ncbi:MAG: hypothetical protein HY904_17610 [Deltaproteobacteria bacterium]|nr:hypothetical protein [Deltaproteobacteria bacterium]
MAKPPEPLAWVLPSAVLVVEADVVEVVATETPSTPGKAPPQVVRLQVRRVLRGTAEGVLEVRKPEGSYQLSAGNTGPFLVGAGQPGEILGRYGPDTWRLADIEAALRG